MLKPVKPLAVLTLLFALTACDQLQQELLGEDPATKAARLEAEGKAVGGACRHSGRAIEDCYSIYHWLQKSAIFAGWQEMDGYMRANNITEIEPLLPPPQPPGLKKKKAASPPPAEESAGSTAPEKTEPPKSNNSNNSNNSDKAESQEKEKPAAK